MGRAGVADFDCTTWNSPGLDGLADVEDSDVLAFVDVLVEVRDSGTAPGFGDGVRAGGGLDATAAFHGAQTGVIFVFRRISGN